MKTFKTILLAAALATPGVIAAGAASAQVNGVAVADPEAAVANSRAFTTAVSQIQTTYKAQLDQANTRRAAIQAELQPLVTAAQTASRAPGATEASLRPQLAAIQAKEQAGNAELGRLTAPAQRARAYAVEQVQRQLATAVQNVVRAKNVSLLISPQATLFTQPAADITPAITAELDRLVPSVSTAVPANWQPGQAAGAPAGAAPAAAAPATSNRKAPTGR
jgi:Skp family chaperone for outer membrane proteins